MTDIAKDLVNYGALGVIVLFVLGMLWKYGPQLVKAHIAFLWHTQQCNESNTKVNESLSETMNGLATTLQVVATTVSEKANPMGDPKFDRHNFSTVQTNKSIGHLCQALQEIIHEHPARERAGPHIQKAIDALRDLR